ncbi:type II toxin-antitoxin system PemK/MazF family toxin [Bacillus paranthracis]|uniref:type II toxin-antitoxin system PemK/MazF family toxin n=1 Tax=Bacillus paranthracis TaxID=2026186 RepID=UPI0021D2E0AA|nr:type II toxin-antitoxin system PemK/MazF family toxin [Bacillus paranthracis]MCU5214265.1 type II toxin-antitoxin system PemK/MazF family toxin [Bacillus paranthracis]
METKKTETPKGGKKRSATPKVKPSPKKLDDRADEILEGLKKVICKMDDKKGHIFLDWLDTKSKYLVWEEKFQPDRLRKYKRSEIVLAHFGFNVGAEYGGMHYAVVLDKNSKTNPLVNVIPLSSLKEDQTESDVHKDEVYLGKIEGLNDKNAIAIPNQMRPISKLRVFRPRLSKDEVLKLTPEQMDLIDEKVQKMYTKRQEK